MSYENNHNPDHDWADPDGSRVIAETLTAMAAGVDPYSPTGPAATLGHMAGRVRRRRTVKVGAAGGSALAVAGLLAFGATQFAPFHDASPVLPGDPSTSASADPTAEPTVQGDERRIETGYQPAELEGTSLACGVPWSEVDVADDLALRSDGPLRTTASRDGDGTWTYASSLWVTPVDDAGTGLVVDGLNWPTLVWTDADGTVVDVGGWGLWSFNNPENASGITEASTTETNLCTGEAATGRIPDGTYEVRAMTLRYADNALIAGEAQQVVISDGEPSTGDGGVEVAEPIDLPEVPDEEIIAQRGINRVVLDRTGERQRWVSSMGDLEAAERLATEGTPFEVRGRCTATAAPQDGADLVVATVRGVWNGETAPSASLVCDGAEQVILPSLVHGADPFSLDGEAGVELTVADTVAQVDVRMVPVAE